MADSTPERPETPTIAVLVGIILNAGLAMSLLALWVGQARQGLFWQSDFSMFYTAWTMVLEKQGGHLYDLDLQLAYQRVILPEGGPDRGLLPFNYPPTTAVPACILALLPLSTAFYAWAAAQLGLLALIVRHFLSLMVEYRAEDRLLMVSTVLAFPAVFVSFQMGQPSLLVLACLTGMTLALERGYPLVSAACLILAAIKPQLAVAPAVVLLAGRYWRTLAYVVGLWLVWAVFTTFFVGPAAWLDWFAVVRRSAGEAGQLGIFPERMYNVKGLLFRLLGPEHLRLINTLSLAALVSAVAAIAVLWLTEVSAFRLRLALSLQLGFLTNLHFNPTDAVVFALPAILYLVERPSSRLAILLVLCPAIFYIDCFGGQPVLPGDLRPFLIVMVFLAIAMGVSLLRNGPRAPGTPDTAPSPAT